MTLHDQSVKSCPISLSGGRWKGESLIPRDGWRRALCKAEVKMSKSGGSGGESSGESSSFVVSVSRVESTIDLASANTAVRVSNCRERVVAFMAERGGGLEWETCS